MTPWIKWGAGIALAAAMVLAIGSQAVAAMPTFETRKITDNVYIYRYQFHQSMFVVTPDGVIATDPIGRYRPQAVTTYISEIRKVTQAPIKWVVYSHHHYDHIAGGKPFKDLGATFIAAGASMKLNDKTTAKVGAGYLRANQLAPAALAGTNLNVSKSMGTEINANVNYNIMKGLDFGLFGAYAWLGDGYKVAGSPSPDNLYALYARLNYAF